MSREWSDNGIALAVSVVGHLLIVALLLFGVRASSSAQPIAANIIEASVVGPMSLPGDLPPLPDPLPPAEIDPEPVVDDTAEREAAEQEAREEAAAKLQEEQDAERQRLADEATEREREAELEHQRLAAEAAERERQAQEQQRLAEEQAAREKQLAEEKAAEEREKARQRRLAEEKAQKERERKAAAERARAAQEARRQAEAENSLKDLMAAEEARRDAVDAGLQAQYIARIKQKIERNWSPPPVSANTRCVLLVRQLRTGDLASVDSVDCGGNAPLERSLRAAAERASPFPRPDDPALFDPNLRILFETEDP